MISILVTGVGGGVGQGIIKSLKLIDDISVRIVAADMSQLAVGMYLGNVSYLVPAASSPDYLKKLSEIFLKEKVDYYFPGTDIEPKFCAQNKAYIEENFNVKVVISPLEAIEISDDKYKTYQFLRTHGMYYPNTILAENVDLSKVVYPIVVKPRVGCRSIGVSIAENENDLSARIENESDLVIQELIGTAKQEYTCTIVVVDGVASDVLILKRSLRAGDTFTADPVKSSVISEYVTNVALVMKINGSCNFQLRVDENDIPKIFEINCRFSGTTPFCAQLGFNPVEFYLKNTMGIEYDYEVDYEAFILRHWSEVVVKKGEMKELFDNLSLVPGKVVRSFL